tara:strand:- start:53 stop:958 length:906 start_codon:yes stop_codon:yes gene_type:complete
MTYQKEVSDYLTKNFDLRPNSVKLYSLKLNQLHKDLGIDYKDGFKNYNAIFNYIKDFKVDKAIAFIHAIIYILDSSNHLIDIYKNKRSELSKIKAEKYENNTKSDNFIDYDKLYNLYIKPDFNDDLKIVLNRMLLYIAIRYPMRNELGNIEIASKKSDMVNPNTNYLYITTRNMWFYMNQYKNVSSMGPINIPIEKEDQTVIREYLKFLKNNKINSKRFLLNYYGGINEFLTNDLFGSKLKLLLKYNFPKNNLTMNDIRKAYETKLINSDEYKSMTNKEKQKKHNKLLHPMAAAHKAYNQV